MDRQGRASAFHTILLHSFGFAVFAMVVFSRGASGATYTVGDSQGWNQGVNYAAWAAKYQFKPGDVLIFTYSTMHSVVEVNQAAFSSCQVTPLNSYTSGNDSVVLSSTKPVQYFICGTGGHCNGGMALQVNITAPSPSPAPGPALAPAPLTATASSPSPSVQQGSPVPVAAKAPGSSGSSSDLPSTPNSQSPLPAASPNAAPPAQAMATLTVLATALMATLWC